MHGVLPLRRQKQHDSMPFAVCEFLAFVYS
ncbi:MAG: hypothetical protein JWO29_1597 [Arthrobacter sp.]|nr:hypothetical protein [Arthrobacter sp.]